MVGAEDVQNDERRGFGMKDTGKTGRPDLHTAG